MTTSAGPTADPLAFEARAGAGSCGPAPALEPALAGRLVALRSSADGSPAAYSLAQTAGALVQLASRDLTAASAAAGALHRHELAQPEPGWPGLDGLLRKLWRVALSTGVVLAANRRVIEDFAVVAGELAAEDVPLALERLGRNESAYWASLVTAQQAAGILESAYSQQERRAEAERAVRSAVVIAAQSFDVSPAAAVTGTSQPLTAAGRRQIARLVDELDALGRPEPVAGIQRRIGAELARSTPAPEEGPAPEEEPAPEGGPAHRITAPLRYGSDNYYALLDEIAARSRGREESLDGFRDQVELLRTAGFGAYRVPRELGGSGGTLRELLRIVADIAERNSNLAHVLRTHGAFIEARLRSTRDDQREYWLRQAAAGVFFANLDGELTATVVGTGASAKASTEIVEIDGRLRLRGRKFYSTGGPYVDRLSVSGVSDGRITRAVVPADRDGVEPQHDWDGFGQVLTESGTTVLDDVLVLPEEVITDDPGSGDRLPYYALGQIYILAMHTGILRSVIRDARALLHRRTRTFSNAAATSPVDDPQLHRVLGDIAAQAFAAQALVDSAATAMDSAMTTVLQRRPDPYLAREFALRIAKAKIVLEETAPRAANAIFDLGGASATRKLYNLDRHWRNIRTLSTHNPAATKARVIGEYLTDPALEFPALW